MVNIEANGEFLPVVVVRGNPHVDEYTRAQYLAKGMTMSHPVASNLSADAVLVERADPNNRPDLILTSKGAAHFYQDTDIDASVVVLEYSEFTQVTSGAGLFNARDQATLREASKLSLLDTQVDEILDSGERGYLARAHQMLFSHRKPDKQHSDEELRKTARAIVLEEVLMWREAFDDALQRLNDEVEAILADRTSDFRVMAHAAMDFVGAESEENIIEVMRQLIERDLRELRAAGYIPEDFE